MCSSSGGGIKDLTTIDNNNSILNQEIFPYAMVMVAATKYASPFIPLKMKVKTFFDKFLTPLSNSITQKRKSMLGVGGV